MTLERSLEVAVPDQAAAKFALLSRQADDAALRLAQGALGDRTEVVRYEQLTSEIEALAYDQLIQETVASPGSAIITLPWPFAEGDAPRSAAAGAQGLAEPVVVVLELVHDPVAKALRLNVPGVVPGGVVGELAEAAGVPVLPAVPLPFRSFVVDVETVAGRAE